MRRDTTLSQFFTPAWAAELIVQHFFPNLSERDVVAEMGCGDGRFLMALPEHVPAFGVELDPTLVPLAERNTGRTIIQGDATEVAFPMTPTVVVGNPPFSMGLISRFLERAYHEMDYGGRVGWILPSYMFQTASTVVKFAEQTMIPRNLFQNFEKPLCFAQFRKDRERTLVGFFLYEETDDIYQLAQAFRTLFVGNDSRANVWGEVLEKAVIELGGRAHLQDIYRVVEGKRPTGTKWWKEQLRKLARKYLIPEGNGVYSLARQEAMPGQIGLALV